MKKRTWRFRAIAGDAAQSWAASVRQAYVLDVTEEVLVGLAEAALMIARDVSLKLADRLAAMTGSRNRSGREVPNDGEITTPTTTRSAHTPGVSANVRPDPRWLLSADAGRVAAHMFFLVTGQMPACRLPGRVSLAQDEATAADVWAQHRDALIAHAAAAGFAPWALTKTRPTGPSVEKWMETFIARHRY